MCGIVGARDAWLRARGVDPATAMRAAVERLRWRGPDGIGVLHIGGWWLGCARLAITQPRSRQPVARRGGRHAGVLNGAITNARALWQELLPAAAARRAPPNDAWLPLLAVAGGRRDLLEQLRGHHAYAVVDAATDELVLAQDRHGEKPLLTVRAAGGDRIEAFASTASALAALDAAPQPEAHHLAGWFRFGFAAATPTRTRHGEAILAATRSPLRSLDADAPLAERLRRSVARCVDATVPVALALSGGVDSSCLAASLRELQAPVPAYQFCAVGAPTAERDVARAVAAHCRLPFRPVDGGPEVLDALPTLTRHHGAPLGDPSLLAVHALARAAAADGHRILLGGEGADELFAGYRRYRALAQLAWLGPIVRFARLPILARLAGLASPTAQRYAARWLRACVAPAPAAALLAVTPPGFAAALATELAEQPSWRDAAQPPGWPTSAEGLPTHLQARAADLDGYLRWDLLPKIDVATLAAGVEGRCPFLEGDFGASAAELALGKRALRRAFAGRLPRRVFQQPKRGFALPLDHWFRGQLPWLDLLADRRTLAREHLRAPRLRELIDAHRAGRVDLGHALYLVVAYEFHLRSQESLASPSGSMRTSSSGGSGA